MRSVNWIMQHTLLLEIIKWALVVLLLLLAVISFRDAYKIKQTTPVSRKPTISSVNRLLFLAIFNPFQLSAWMIWGSYLIEKSWFNWTSISILTLSIGASIGTYLILFGYAYTGTRLVNSFSRYHKHINYVIAGILLFLGILQLVKNLKD